MTSPDPAAILAQINAAREQTYQNIALAQGILDQANAAASAAAQDRAAIQAIAQQTVSVDTSVGTRVFAGDEMIHGDTGWRDVSRYLAEGLTLSANLGRCRIRRVGSRVEFDLKVDVNVSGLTQVFATTMPGFSAISNYPMSAAIFHANARNVGASAFEQGGYAGVFYSNGSPLRTGSSTPWPHPGCIAWTDSYATNDPWPTSLPGSPA